MRAELAHGDVKLPPTTDWLRKQVVRFDLLSILWRRLQNDCLVSRARYLSFDASWQFGWNMFMVKEDTLELDKLDKEEVGK